MLFGEVVEPSTRALILDDDLEELPEYIEPVFEWEGNPKPPDDIENIIFADSQKVTQICTKITKNAEPVAKLKDKGLSIFKMRNTFLIIFDGHSTNFAIGEIVTHLSPWIKKAKSIHAITSTLISTFQPFEELGTTPPVTFSRCLTNNEDVPFNLCKRLECPNLIEGFGASILTYCIHNNVKASLWVIYSDNMPVDSVNSAEIVRLFKVLGIDVKVDFKADASSSNLYM